MLDLCDLLYDVKDVVLELARNLTGKQPLAYRSHYLLFRKGRNITTYQHAALVLRQVDQSLTWRPCRTWHSCHRLSFIRRKQAMHGI